VAAAFTTRRLVEFRDTDAAGIAHFSAFFPWMESAEHELLRSIGVALIERLPDDAVPGGPAQVSWPRVSAACDYTSAVRFGDELDVAVTVEALGRSSVTYGFRFTHGDLEVARGRVVAVRCILRPDRRPEPEPIPEDVAARLARFHGAA
jgi:acyl-CoA thioester hydrolase